MSKATKRKHVVKEVLEDYVTPTEDQQIMRILGSNGNNLHKAVTGNGEHFLISMPTKFRKNIWIKRGDFVIVDPIKEGGKVKAEISFILYRDHIHYLRKIGVWPEGFQDDQAAGETNEEMSRLNECERKEEENEQEGDSDSQEDDSDLFVNTNRATVYYSESEEETDDEDEEEEEDDETKA